MSAVVAAMARMRRRYVKAALSRHGHAAHTWKRAVIAAGRTIVDASNAAGAGRVVEGAPRTSRVSWAGPGTRGEWTAYTEEGAESKRPALRRTVDGVRQPDMAPTWDGCHWLWGTWGHDPHPCAWPRPFKVAQKLIPELEGIRADT